MWKRIIADIVLFILVLFTPWWVMFVFAIAFSFYFRNFYELVVAGFLIDALYGIGVVPWGGIGAGVLYIIIFLFKKKLRHYN